MNLCTLMQQFKPGAETALIHRFRIFVRAMMEFVHVALAVLSLLSVGHSAPVTNCESLIQPLEIQGRDQLLGKWNYLAESTNIPGSQLLTKMFMESVWGRVTAGNEDDGINALFSIKMLGRCYSYSVSYTLANNTVSMVRPYVSSSVLLNTGCPDCLVYSIKSTFGGSTYAGVQLLSRRSKVTDAELEEFKKQAECLNLPSATFLDPERGMCPEDSPSQETETIDLTNVMNGINSGTFDIFNNIIRSEDRLKTLIKLFSTSIPGLKQN